MSILDKILRRRQDPPPDPYLGRQKNRTILKAALQNRAPSYKNYVNYAAFPDRIPPTADKETHDQVIRRAVHYTNAQLGIQGLVRSDFSKELNDRLARSAVFSICEKAIIDYFGTAEWEIVDEAGKAQTDAMRWLRKPNPHQTLNMVLKEVVRDTIRYDAGVLVNSLRADGTLGEVRAFHGPDWWIEVDRDWTALDGIGSQYYGPWSHGLVRRYWQHSRPGIYIPFDPEEICYFMLYPRTDSMYGTDFLSRIRWQLEYLIDSTRAAGMTYANGIAPGAVWKHPDYTSIEELAERELDIELNHLGAENFGGIVHLIGNESIESFTPTLHDMQWLEGQKFFTEMVLAMFGFASSEFFQGDVNRATAYIGRNITKSRMLYPLQVAYEQMITEKILPLMEGWDDDWEFTFVDTVDLDDELKRAQINQTRASTASSYAMLGISIESALELAEVPDDLQTAIRESLEDLKDQEGDWTDGLPQELPQEEAEQYYGDPGGEDYRGTAIDGDDAENREDGVQKARARVYLKPGEQGPAGAKILAGPRGGRYYEVEGRGVTTSYDPKTDPHAPGGPGTTGRSPGAGREAEYTIPARPWEMEKPEEIEWDHGERERLHEELRFRYPNLERFARHEGRRIGPGFYAYIGGERRPVPEDMVIGRAWPNGHLCIMGWGTYRRGQKNAAFQREYPKISPQVDMQVHRKGVHDWNTQSTRALSGDDVCEVATVFSRDGEVLLEKVGNHNSVVFDSDELDLMGHEDGRIFTHTHPSSNSFSVADLRVACQAGLTEMRAVGRDYEYIFLPPEGLGRFTEDLWATRYAELASRVENNLRDEMWERIHAGTITPEEANRLHYHTLWTRFAEQSDLRYIRRERYSHARGGQLKEGWGDEQLIHVQREGEDNG